MHTSGHWTIDATRDNTIDIRANGCRIAMLDEQERITADELKANANLISAAPDLFYALTRLLKTVEHLVLEEDEIYWPSIQNARDIIAKAKGE